MTSTKPMVLEDIACLNPTRSLSRGDIAPFIDMASLPIGKRDVESIQRKEFKGSGSKFKNGDTLLARITPCLENGKTAKVTGLSEDEVGFGSTEFIVLSAKDKKDEDYLYYLARHPDFRNYAIARMEGTSGRQRVAWQSIKDYEFDFPDAEQRRWAGQSLKSLDHKIKLNNQINKTLESIAQTLFQSWFVDFDPVKAKLAARRHGRDPERAAMAAISGKLSIPPGKPKPEILDDQLPSSEALDAAMAALDELSDEQHDSLVKTASLFPDNFEETELGLIPSGWSVSEIGKEVGVYGGSTPSTKNKEFWGGEYYWATPKDLASLSQKMLITTEKKITDKGVAKISSRQLPAGTVLMSSRAPVGYLAISAIPISINQGFIAMVCNKTLPKSYLLHWIEKNMDQIKSMAGGSTFAEISKKNFKPIKCLIPASELLAVFDSMCTDYFEQIKLNLYQCNTLECLRDSLLPKLLSGEIRIPEAEQEPEQVSA